MANGKWQILNSLVITPLPPPPAVHTQRIECIDVLFFVMAFSYVKRFESFEMLRFVFFCFCFCTNTLAFYKSHWDFRLNGKINFSCVFFSPLCHSFLSAFPFHFRRMNTKIKVWWQKCFSFWREWCKKKNKRSRREKTHKTQREYVKHQTADMLDCLERPHFTWMLDNNIQMLYFFFLSLCSFLSLLSLELCVLSQMIICHWSVRKHERTSWKWLMIFFLHFFFFRCCCSPSRTKPDAAFVESMNLSQTKDPTVLWNVCESDRW